jgi:hypothetical protein
VFWNGQTSAWCYLASNPRPDRGLRAAHVSDITSVVGQCHEHGDGGGVEEGYLETALGFGCRRKCAGRWSQRNDSRQYLGAKSSHLLGRWHDRNGGAWKPTPLGRLSWRGAGGAIERNSQFDVGSHGQVFPRAYRNSRCHVNRGIRLCRLHTIGASIGCVFRDTRLAAK